MNSRKISGRISVFGLAGRSRMQNVHMWARCENELGRLDPEATEAEAA